MAPSSSWGRRQYVFWVLAWIAAGWLVRLPLLSGGLASDDYVHKAMLEGTFSASRAAWDLFDFSARNAAERSAMTDSGALPYWAHPDLQLAMFRPLSSYLSALEHRFFGHALVVRHGLSFAAWGALAVAVAALYRFLLPGAVAALAFALFAVDESHTLPMAWLAHRGALWALLCGLIAWWLQVREGRHSASWTGAWFALALAFGEWALPLLGYALARAAVVERGPLRARLRMLLPWLVPAALYLGLRALSGRGVVHSGMYVDATAEPLRFLASAVVRVPVLVADLVLSLGADHYVFGGLLAGFPLPREAHVLAGVLALGLLALITWLGTRDGSCELRREGAAFALGALACLLPTVGAFPTRRLLLPAAIGYSAVLALCVRFLWLRAQREGGVGRALPALGLMATLLLAGIAPARAVLAESAFLTRLYPAVRRAYLELPLEDSELAQSDLVLLSTLDHTTQVFGPSVLRALGRPAPRSMVTLSVGPTALRVQRVAPRRVRVSLFEHGLLAHPFARLYRSSLEPMAAGQQVLAGPGRITVHDVGADGPRTLELQFTRSPSEVVFLQSTAHGLQRVSLPPVGKELIVPQPRTPWVD